MTSTETVTSTATISTTSTFIAGDYTTEPDFQGWYLQATPQPIVCAGTQTYYTSSTYAGCFDPTSTIPLATGCNGVTLLQVDLEGSCETASGYSCSSYKIFPTEGSDDDQALVRYACLLNWGANSIYRTLPARFDLSTAAAAVTGTVATASLTAIATTTSALATPTSTSISSKSQSGLTGGDIAGIVVGSVAAVAIVALLIFFRRHLMGLFGIGSPFGGSGPAWSPVYAPAQTQSAAHTEDSTWQPSEMSAEDGAIHEMSSVNVSARQPEVIHELG